MGNGSVKPGDARADRARDKFARLRAKREKALRELDEADWDGPSKVEINLSPREPREPQQSNPVLEDAAQALPPAWRPWVIRGLSIIAALAGVWAAVKAALDGLK